jgi:3-phosphoshikimate 1-carboxyvinyltransferase
MDHRDLPPARRAEGILRLPGSKSITNRALLLAALARGTTRLEALLESDDTRVMREALKALGVGVEPVDGAQALDVTGIGGSRFPVKRAGIFVGNSGTSARSLVAALALADGDYVVSGVPRMHERPIADLVDALRAAGARIEYRGAEGFPPLGIGPHGLSSPSPRGSGLSVTIRGDISSQFTSGLLMALGATGLAASVAIEGELISKPYVELTLASMAQFGVRVAREGWERFRIPAGSGYVSPGTVRVEGDASSASYFLAAGILGGGPVRVEGVGRDSAQGDVHFSKVLEAMGAKVRFGSDWIEASGHGPLEPFDLDMNRIPDAAMTAAVLALFATGPSTLRGIGSWRVKETDRIAAMATELMKFGADVDAGSDFLRVAPPKDFLRPRAPGLAPVSVATYDDHRMAMCFSLASFGPVPVRILDPGCVSKTFPGYFDAFARIVH